MPTFDKPNMPSKPNKPESFKGVKSPFRSPEPLQKPGLSEKHEFKNPYGGNNLLYPEHHESIIEQSTKTFLLRKHMESPAGRAQIAKKLRITNTTSEGNAQRIQNVIEGVLEKVKEFGPIIDPKEKRSLKSPARTTKQYFDAKRILAKELEDHIVDIGEKKARQERKTVKETVDEELGLND